MLLTIFILSLQKVIINIITKVQKYSNEDLSVNLILLITITINGRVIKLVNQILIIKDLF